MKNFDSYIPLFIPSFGSSITSLIVIRQGHIIVVVVVVDVIVAIVVVVVVVIIVDVQWG